MDALDGTEIERAVEAGILKVLSCQEHLNRINVFPVPDGDTGTNLVLTLSAVRAILQRTANAHAGAALTHIADAALDGARGNSGAILAQFLFGVGDCAGHLERLTPGEFVAALRAGAGSARDSMSEPREGTMLTVIDAYARALEASLADDRDIDFVELLAHAGLAARDALAHTTDQLESLRRANVVDAGALGFVELMDGFAGNVASGFPAVSEIMPVVVVAGELTAGDEASLEHRYCTECVVTGDPIDRRRLRERLAEIGSSLIVAGSARKAKIHVHANDPAEVFRIAGSHGTLSGEKADDMLRQQHSAHQSGRRVAIVTDSAADMTDADIDRLDIHVVPVRVHFGERSFLDKIGITPEEFFAELARGTVHPKTSQPPPGDFRRRFEFLTTHYPAVVSINLTSRASGTCNAARVGRERTQAAERVTVVDSLNASVGQGLLVLDAAERAAAGADRAEIEARLAEMIPRTRTYGLIGSLDHAVRGGRVPRSVKAIADLVHLRPILASHADGRVSTGGFLLGYRELNAKFARFVLRRLDRSRRYRIAIGHAAAEAAGRELLDRLAGALPNVDNAGLMPLGSALGVHGGPGMLVVGVQERAS
jgi:DegV family protein with EDD domain